jgi:hypothetical protein
VCEGGREGGTSKRGVKQPRAAVPAHRFSCSIVTHTHGELFDPSEWPGAPGNGLLVGTAGSFKDG